MIENKRNDMIENLEIKFSKQGVNYTLTPHTDYFDSGFAYDFANMIGEIVKMSNVNPAIVIKRIKEISETENTNNNE